MPLLSNHSLPITQMTTSGQSIWLNLGTSMPKSASLVLTLVNASALVTKIEYSDDGSTVTATSQNAPSVTDAGTAKLVYPVSTQYPYVRINWVSGTATSLNASLESTLIS